MYVIGDAVTPTEEIIRRYSLDNLRGKWGLVSKVEEIPYTNPQDEWVQYWIFFPEEPYPRERGDTHSVEDLSWIFVGKELLPWEGE